MFPAKVVTTYKAKPAAPGFIRRPSSSSYYRQPRRRLETEL